MIRNELGDDITTVWSETTTISYKYTTQLKINNTIRLIIISSINKTLQIKNTMLYGIFCTHQSQVLYVALKLHLVSHLDLYLLFIDNTWK